MARDRSIALRVRADVADAVRGLRDVGDAAKDVGDQSEQAGQRARSVGQRVVQSARDQGSEWRTVGTALTAYGAAVTGVSVAVLKTGIQYNTLRQTAGAAMTTMLGSAEAAAAQMDRLDQFANTSPFARQVWITAQQQLIGFGVEADRVIPILGGVQDAVAAVGGGNAEVERIVYALAQMQSQGRLTGQTLNQVGQYGIDMAVIIGEQVGMTGEEIRKMAMSPGGIPVDQIWDPLISGMNQNFGGAAENLRETFEGAWDRVTAVIRDVSALLAKGLVDPEGGGALVGWLNSLADAGRELEGILEAIPDPVRNAAFALGALTGPLALVAGGALVAVPHLLSVYDSLGRMGRVGELAQRGIRASGRGLMRFGGYAVTAAIGAVAIGNAVQALQGHFRDAALGTRELERAMRQADFDAPFSRLSGAYAGLSEAFDVLTGGGALNRLDRFMSAINQGFGGHLPDDVQAARDEFAAMGSVLGALVDSGNAEAAAEMFGDMAAELGLTADQHELLLALMPAYSDALAGLELDQAGAADGAHELADGLGEAEAALESLTEALADGASSFVDILGAWDAVIEKNKELAEESAAASKSTTDSWEDFYDGHSVNIGDYLDELQAQVDAQREWEANMTILAGRVSQGTLEELAKLGPEGAPLVAALVDASDEELARMEELMAAGSATAGAAFAAELIEAIPLIRNAMGRMSDEAIGEMAERLRSGESTIQDEIDSWMFGPPAPVEVEVDTAPGRSGFEAMVDDFATTTTDTPLDIDHSLANQNYNTLMGGYEGDVTLTPIDVDGALANRNYNLLMRGYERDVTDTPLDADTSPAQRAYDSWDRAVSRDVTETNLGADDSRARGTVTSLGGWAWRQRTQVNVTANTSTAAAQIRSLSGIRVTAHAAVARASGGPVFGPGSETSDSILAALSHNEHVLSAREVRGLGGHGAVEQIRAMARAGVRAFADGGTPAYQYRPSLQPAPAPSPAAASGPVTAVLAPEDRDLLAAVASRPVQVQMGRRTLAEATAVAGEYGRSRGQGRG